MRRALVGTFVVLGALSCDSSPRQAVTSCQSVGLVAEATDILFVVDDSGSMATKQAILASNFAGFIDELSRLPVRNDYQIGVTTTSVDRFDPTTDTYPATFDLDTWQCPAASNPWGLAPDPAANAGNPYPAGALVRVEGGSDPCSRLQLASGTPRILAASSPTLVADFTANAFVGVAGSGKEQGLEAARLAVTAPLLSGANSGFLRSGARLVVVVVSDDDDCSDPLHQGTNEPPGCTSYPVQDYVDFFQGSIAGESRDVLVAVIGAVDPVTLQPSQCQVLNPDGSGTGVYAEHAAPRYKQFVDAFGADGIIDSVCNASFQRTLSAIATRIGQQVPLGQTPADWRLLQVTVASPGGSAVACQVGLAGDPTADVVYAPPTATRPPTLTFQGKCAITAGDQVGVKLLCAG